MMLGVGSHDSVIGIKSSDPQGAFACVDGDISAVGGYAPVWFTRGCSSTLRVLKARALSQDALERREWRVHELR